MLPATKTFFSADSLILVQEHFFTHAFDISKCLADYVRWSFVICFLFKLCDVSLSKENGFALMFLSMAKRNRQRAFALAIQSSDHLISEKYYEAAATILERYLNIHPPHSRVLRRLGRVRLYQGRPQDAVPLLAHALKIDTVLSTAA